jgi:flagellar hook-basal body complex protein FliE
MLPIGSVDISSLIGNPERLQGASGAGTVDPDTISQALGAASNAASASGAIITPTADASSGAVSGGQPMSFSHVLQNAVEEVNSKMQAADVEKGKLLTGETSNIHQAMIAVQESNVAFGLMVEVRNKLVDSYQELMRMQV